MLQCDQELYGNNAIINLNSDNSAIRSLVMAGDVIVKQPSTGIVIRTTELDADMNDGTYSTGRAYFRLAREMPKLEYMIKNILVVTYVDMLKHSRKSHQEI